MGKCTHWSWNPEETSKRCTSERRESTLTGEWNHDEAAKHAPLTHGIANSLVNETLKIPVNHAPLKHREVNSLVNETLMKAVNCALLKHEKVNSVVNETLMKPVNHETLTHGKVYSLEMKPWGTRKRCTSERWESILTGEWNHDEAAKLRTSETWKSEVPGEWNPKETSKPCTSETQ